MGQQDGSSAFSSIFRSSAILTWELGSCPTVQESHTTISQLDAFSSVIALVTRWNFRDKCQDQSRVREASRFRIFQQQLANINL